MSWAVALGKLRRSCPACRARSWLAGWSQVEDQVVTWLRAAGENVAVGWVIDRVGGVADRSGHDGCLAARGSRTRAGGGRPAAPACEEHPSGWPPGSR